MIKKKVLVMLLAGTMTCFMLTACGGAAAEPTQEAAKTENVVTDVKTEAEGSDMVSDETFANLQESYTSMVDAYNAVCDLYTSDEIAADTDIEELINKVKSIMEDMGEITQDTITEEDAATLFDVISALADSLGTAVDGMETTAAADDFTLLDVTSDMIDAAIYVGDEDSELVLSLFTMPDGTPMCSMLEYDSAADTGDVACGAYTADTATDEKGISWTYLTFDDVYTGDSLEMGFGETEAGECVLMLPSGDIYDAQYLDNEEAITYMGTAVALLTK